MIKNFSPEDVVRKYLDKHLEPDFLTEEEQALIKKYHDQLKKPEEGSFPIEYYREGTVEYTIKDLGIKFSYEEIPEADFALITIPLEIVGEPPLLWDHERSHWRLLTDYTITKGAQILSIADFIPKNYSVLIHTDPENKEGARFSPKRKAITMPYDLRKPKSIVALLHELGHLQDYERLETEEDKKHFDAVSSLKDPIEWKDMIQQERNATAFALRMYKPFLDDYILGKDGILMFMHEALQTYSDKVKVRMVANRWKTDSDEAAYGALKKEKEDTQWIDDLFRALKEVL